jgi:hypothetical protein
MYAEIWLEKPEVKRPFRRPRHRWVDSITINAKETGYGGGGWACLDHNRDQWRDLVNPVTHSSSLPQNAVNLSTT